MCWVSVQTQLPEEGATVDCWVVNARAPNGKRSPDVYFAEGRFYGIQTPWVTHWRYPPAPPAWKAMSAEAPAVQGEPTRQYYYKVNSCKALSPDSDQCICWHYEGEGPLADGSAKSWRVAPIKPAEQQPLTSSLALEAASHLTNWLDMNWCECEGGHFCGYNEVKRTRDALLEAAEQKPATDLAPPAEYANAEKA